MTKIAIAGGNDNHCIEEVVESARNDREFNFSDIAGKYGVVILMQETSEQELIDLNKELPTDTHLVTYETENFTVGHDAVRAYKMSDIFDLYSDANVQVRSITSGFGAIKPKLFVDSTKKGS